MKQKNKKIIFFIASLSGGGAEKVIAELCNYFSNIGNNVILVTLDYNSILTNKYSLDLEVNHYCLGNLTKIKTKNKFVRLVKNIYLIRNFIKNTNPDTLISFITETNICLIIANLFLHKRLIISDRVDPSVYPKKKYLKFLRYILYRFADVVVVQTKDIKSFFNKNIPSHTIIIPNSARYCNHTRNDSSEKFILYAGRLHHQKGVDILISSFDLIASQIPHWNLIILGDGPERLYLENMVSVMGLDKRIKFKGYVDNILSYLLSASIYVQLSRYEGLSNSILEAMAVGLPVVTTSQGASGLITNGINGMIVPSDNYSIANSILNLIEDKNLMTSISKEAKNVCITYSKDIVYTKWKQIVLD